MCILIDVTAKKADRYWNRILTLIVFRALFFGVFDIGEMLFVHQP